MHLGFAAEAVELDPLTGCGPIVEDQKRLDCYDKARHQQDLPPTLAETALGQRIQQEHRVIASEFGIIPYKPIFIMPYTINASPNDHPRRERDETEVVDQSLDHMEAKFQISFRVPLLAQHWPKKHSFWLGYTQVSLWQLYNSESSAPFRETNYEPEFIWNYLDNDKQLGMPFNFYSISLNHQSNGRSDPLSRSWNRIISTFGVYEDNWILALRPWYRFEEQLEDDDNPNIEDFIGYGDMLTALKLGGYTLTGTLKNNLRTDNNLTSVNLGLSFKMGGRLKGYLEFYNGYGETLLDYNHRNIRFGIGLMLIDWL